MKKTKKGRGVLIFLFVTGMIFGAMQPAMLYGAETSGNVWDRYVDPGPYLGTWFQGPLSMYFDILDPNVYGTCDNGNQIANMYYTVRLNKEWQIFKPTLYTFQGMAPTCLNDWEYISNVIKYFLGTVVVPAIFPNGFTSWKLKSFNKGQYHDDDYSRAFVADIEISVRR